jgi:hypothetical protein
MKLNEATLEHLAYLFFNFRHVGRHHWCVELVKFVEIQHELVCAKLRNSDLRTIEFFVWNMWIALENSEALEFIGREDIMLEIVSVATSGADDQESLFALIGTLFLGLGEAPQRLASLCQLTGAVDSIEKSIQLSSTKTVRVLAGLRAATYVPDAAQRARYIEALSKAPPRTDIQNEAIAHGSVLDWLRRLG